jgi:aspartate/methionine/tyrosine aminotransferase
MREAGSSANRQAVPVDAGVDPLSAGFGLFEPPVSTGMNLTIGELNGVSALRRLWNFSLAELDPGRLLGSYPSTQGTWRLAESVQWLRAAERGERVDPYGIVASHGGLDALCHALAPLPAASPVFYATPGWLFQIPVVRAGHRPCPLPWRLEDPVEVWLDLVEKKVAGCAGPAGLIVNFPRNPSGTLARAGDWDRLADLVTRYDMLLVVDDVYGFEDPSSRRLPAGHDRVVVVDSVSKRLGAPGLRLGYLMCSRAELPAVRASAARTSVGVSPLVSELAAIAIERYVAEQTGQAVRDELAARRRRTREAGGSLGDRLLLADHGLYGCVRIPDGVASEQFAAELRRQGFALSVGGDIQGPYLRFCLGSHPDVHQAAKSIAALEGTGA